MPHRLFTLATALSLLLYLATNVLWVRSYSPSPPDIRIGLPGRDAYLSIQAREGQAEFSPGNPQVTYFLLPYPNSPSIRWPTLAEQCSVHLGGFGLSWTDPTGWHHPNVVMPNWLLTIVTLLLPLAWIVRQSSRRRRAQGGLCPNCGYDLRATAERCPECGTTLDGRTMSHT